MCWCSAGGKRVIRDSYVMDLLYTSGVHVIQKLQDSLSAWDGFMQGVSIMSDPSYMYRTVFLFAAIADSLLAAKVLLAAILSEWSNIIMKWFLMDSRPYWYVMEAEIRAVRFPTLVQSPITCETTPGNPSGHVMTTAAVMYVVVKWCIEAYAKRKNLQEPTKRSKIAFWSTYWAILLLVSTSRMYLATHFYHQCILGAILGVLVGHYLVDEKQKVGRFLLESDKCTMFKVTALLISSSFAAFWIQRALRLDPSWAAKMAFKWCMNPTEISVTTTPVYALVRACGTLLGLSAASPNIAKTPRQHSVCVAAATSLLLGFTIFVAQDNIFSEYAVPFFSAHFFLFSVQPYVLLEVMPCLSKLKNKYKNE